MKHSKHIPVGSEGLLIETGHVARQANGSCLSRAGDTVVLATACMAGDPTIPRPFLPLTVDYREYSHAAGRIPGGFFKREGRPSEKEIITCRLIDRPLRPLFPEGYFAETQVIAMVMSADGEHDPDVLAINGAAFALALSDIPFYHPLGAVRVGYVDGEILFNPTNSERDVSELDLIVVGTEQAIVMVEAGANQLPEDLVLDCIFSGHAEIQKIIEAQKDLVHDIGRRKPVWQVPEAYPAALAAEVEAGLSESLWKALYTKEKFARKAAVSAAIAAYVGDMPQTDPDKYSQVKKIINKLEAKLLARAVLEEEKRFDGRALDEIRDIHIDLGFLPRTHGSAVFTRGETQAMVSATLGTRRDAQIMEEYEGESLQKFMLHYNFPPFCVGEVKFLRGPGRREIGHGLLARRALTPVIPDPDDFPYTIRIVSDILESNGSSSMATVCGGSLALFDAGIPASAPVAGVAMGLIKRGDRFAVLSDIAGQEDHHGDMDFKVAGTSTGITALQMDIKITGVTKEIMQVALAQARRGREHLLGIMNEALGTPREDMSQWAPRLYNIMVARDKIRDVIGPGGKTIRALQEETGCEIEIEDSGKVTVAAPDGTAARRAIELIEKLTEVPEVGKIYEGLVTRVENFGAFVEILPGTEGLLHISELAPFRVREVTDIVREGDNVRVKVLDIDPSGHRMRLSRRAVVIEDPSYDAEAEMEKVGGSADTGERDRDGGSDRGGRDRGGPGGRDRGRGGRGGRDRR